MSMKYTETYNIQNKQMWYFLKIRKIKQPSIMSVLKNNEHCFGSKISLICTQTHIHAHAHSRTRMYVRTRTLIFWTTHREMVIVHVMMRQRRLRGERKIIYPPTRIRRQRRRQ
jgi:hypothetical protein